MRAAIVAGVIALAGCLDALDPQVGPARAPLCTDEDGEPGRATSYQVDVVPILEEYCFRCHTPGGASPIGLEIGRLDLSSYSGIRAGGSVSGARAIAPGRPCASLLLQKLGPAPPFGSRMPLNGPPFVDDEDLEILHDWIAEGALEN